MMRNSRIAALLLAVLLAAGLGFGRTPQGTMAITVSMGHPSAHYFHVALRCEGLTGESLDFKMPAWSPGYYRIMDYAKNVVGFTAADGRGKPLAWEKTAKNTWRVKTGGAKAAGQAAASPSVTVVSYDVYAFTRFVADSYLDDARAFIVPTGVFMHVAGLIEHPVIVTVEPYEDWHTIATGLEPLAGRPGTFTAPDFDVLYDCPILMGNQDILPFEVRGVPHAFVGDGLGRLDQERFVGDLAKIVEASAALVGEIPYTHYAFLAIGPGGGGLEHANSAALSFTASGTMSSPAAYKRWLEFVAHEFFHLYNVKRIRPIALGPFDYDRENYTTLLWMSEGFTSYYESLILRRAGLITREDVFEDMRKNIAGFENGTGHRFQSAAASSVDTWLDFYGRSGNSAATTISYYDKGAALGMLLDFRIRHETRNRASLDDVIRTLYRKYYKSLGRGFTDAEFRAECERAAGGARLDGFFDDYVASTRDIDYARYLGYAGLEIDLAPLEKAGGWLGASFGEASGGTFARGPVQPARDGNAVISGVEPDSPAWLAGLSVQDEIVAIDGERVTARSITSLLETRKPGDKVKLQVSRRGEMRNFDVGLGRKSERSFAIKPMARPDSLQAAILAGWLGER
jgi:predicted metalloprotease with PDZ domain